MNQRVRVSLVPEDYDRDPAWAFAKAEREAAEKARMLGAPGRARVVHGYDIMYLVDYVEVQWVTPVLGSKQPPDLYAGKGPIKQKISKRLGEIPR